MPGSCKNCNWCPVASNQALKLFINKVTCKFCPWGTMNLLYLHPNRESQHPFLKSPVTRLLETTLNDEEESIEKKSKWKAE